MLARRQLSPPALCWQLRVLTVCGSTEQRLSQWLQTGGADDCGVNLALDPALHPALNPALSPTLDSRRARALLAIHQRYGHGQRGRSWSAPPGGLWLSASLPWPADAANAASLSLAVAVGLALELEALELNVRIKWPNDLLVQGRKIAGLLPRLRLRAGRVVGARIGLGLNGSNRVPPGAINLSQALMARRSFPRAAAANVAPMTTAALAAKGLRALEWAVAAAGDGEAVRRAAEARLLLGADPLIENGQAWEPVGLERDGALRVRRQGEERLLQRSF